MVILAQKWAEVYMSQKADTKIQVTGGGSGTGIAALQNQTTDLCNASRSMKAAEIAECIKAFNKRPTEYKVALDGLSVYVNESNPVKELTLEQLGLIFTGKIKNWKEVGGPDGRITLYSGENSSGTYEFFKEHVLDGADFSSKAQTMPGTAAVLEAVAKDKTSIGYGGAGYGKGAKHLAIKKNDSSPAIEPEIILMDEPASALDPVATAKVEDLILDLKKDFTIVIGTHNMQQAARISDYTAFFYLGELVEYDTTMKMFTNPSNKRTEDYVTGRFG